MTRKPDNRPTGSKVRHGCRRAGGGPYVVLDWWDANVRIRALDRWERRQKKRAGRRNRAVGHIGVAVYAFLARRAVKMRGRLDDLAYEAIAAVVGYSRSAVVAACQRLKAHGWLDWDMCYAPTGQPGLRGPQVEQTYNSFRIAAPVQALLKLGIRLCRPPGPDDDETARNAAAGRAMALADSPLGASLDRLGRLVGESETSTRQDSMRT